MYFSVVFIFVTGGPYLFSFSHYFDVKTLFLLFFYQLTNYYNIVSLVQILPNL
ncbi:hypothetical protein EDC94DRAFT_600196 [Helicostylum pulchrum]|nr:hypothetical protein EDC94DRAFT_600196 [Helicostylum pulchrum]